MGSGTRTHVSDVRLSIGSHLLFISNFGYSGVDFVVVGYIVNHECLSFFQLVVGGPLHNYHTITTTMDAISVYDLI